MKNAIFELRPEASPPPPEAHYLKKFQRNLCTSPGDIYNEMHVKLVEFGHVLLPPDFDVQGSAPLNEINLIESGSGTITHHGVDYALRPGAIFLFPSHHPMRWHHNKNLRKFYIHFQLLYQGADLLSGESPVVLPIHAEGRRVMDRCQSIFSPGNPRWIVAKIKSLVYDILSLMAQSLDAPLLRKQSISSQYIFFFQYIQNSIHGKFSLREASRFSHVSAQYFSNKFKHDFGISPKQYFLREKINRIKLDLTRTNQTLAEISDHYGFADQFYFSKLFKHVTGSSPSHYRHSAQKFRKAVMG